MRAHTYDGRERGIMLIGSNSDLRALAEQLSRGVNEADSKAGDAWPPQIASFDVGRDSADPFKVSFHVENSSGAPPTNVGRRTGGFYLFLAMSPLALLGAYTLVQWVERAF